MANSDNPKYGSEFEKLIQKYFMEEKSIELYRNFSVELGFSKIKKSHKFDLGSDKHKIIIECKRHRWTKGSNTPSAKMSVWNEAMLYFSMCNVNEKYKSYSKYLVVLKDIMNGKSLAQYYVDTYLAYIPDTVEIFEFDIKENIFEKVSY